MHCVQTKKSALFHALDLLLIEAFYLQMHLQTIVTDEIRARIELFHILSQYNHKQ